MNAETSQPHCENCSCFSKSLFASLERHELCALEQFKQMKNVQRRDRLFQQDEEPAGFYCVSSGQFKVFQTGMEGRDQIVRLAGPGDPIGYRALFSQETYQASAEALEDSTVCFFAREAILDFFQRNPSLIRRLLQWLCQDLRSAEERLRQFAQKPVIERVAETLVSLAWTFGKPGNQGIEIEIRLTRQEIADLAGTVVETAVRALSELKRQNLLCSQGRRLIVRDLKALARLAKMEGSTSFSN